MAKKSPPHDPTPLAPKPPAKVGAPTIFTEELANEILRRHSGGETMASICRDEHMPDFATVWRWEQSRTEFSKAYTRARLSFTDAVFDQAMLIADEAAKPLLTPSFTKLGEAIVDVKTGEPVMKTDLNATKARAYAARVRVDTRLRICALINPAKYGQRLAVHHSGSIDMGGVDDATLNARIERKLHELGLVAMLRGWKIAEARISELLGLFRVVELPTAPAPLRLLPGETEKDLEL